ncbi:MAG: hypothetical protein IPF79_04950 [Ignavibacteria bacterium]|nr:hypothetical protein [Ignavibacteria bacterium]
MKLISTTLVVMLLVISNSFAQKMTYKADDVLNAVKKFADWMPPDKNDFETWDAYFDRMPQYDTNRIYTHISKHAFTFYDIDDSSLTHNGPAMLGCDNNGCSHLQYLIGS